MPAADLRLGYGYLAYQPEDGFTANTPWVTALPRPGCRGALRRPSICAFTDEADQPNFQFEGWAAGCAVVARWKDLDFFIAILTVRNIVASQDKGSTLLARTGFAKQQRPRNRDNRHSGKGMPAEPCVITQWNQQKWGRTTDVVEDKRYSQDRGCGRRGTAELRRYWLGSCPKYVSDYCYCPRSNSMFFRCPDVSSICKSASRKKHGFRHYFGRPLLSAQTEAFQKAG